MNKKNKVIFFVITGILLILICSCNNEESTFDIADVYEYREWSNTLATAIAQTEIAKIVEEHMDADVAGKTKKAIILGFDGARADAIAEAINRGSSDSGLDMLIEKGGGVYFAYCGGTNRKNQQRTETAPGWASLLTGVWGNGHGVKKNYDIKNLTYKTVMLKYAEKTVESAKPLKTCFAASWNSHFDDTYSPEMKHIKDNSNIKMTYYNMVSDSVLQSALLSFVNDGQDIIFGIYEDPDSAGHEYGFSTDVIEYTNAIKRSDSFSYAVINKIYDRSTFADEDWLILMTTDHGGLNKDHGGQSAEERATWIVSNKKIDEKYFSSNYDGFLE